MPQPRLTHRDRAIVYIAGYETADAGRYEREVTRVARRWLGMLGSRHTTQGMVNKLLDEVASTDASDFGCAWDDLKRDLHRWALEEGWLEPPAAAHPSTRKPQRSRNHGSRPGGRPRSPRAAGAEDWQEGRAIPTNPTHPGHTSRES